MNAKTVEKSKATIANLMMPEHANHTGNVHGGEIMKLMDHAAGIVAARHARKSVVTARVDQLEFHQPVHVANLVTCSGYLTFVGRSSMEVFLTVTVEDVTKDDDPKVALTAYFTMVAINKDGRPEAVPPLQTITPEEQALFEEGKLRYERYKQKQRQG